MTNSLNIFYVEDDSIEVELLSINMKRHYPTLDLNFDVAKTVADAKALFSKGKYNAALIDWNLPDGEGSEVAALIRHQDDQLPIMFLSASVTTEHLKDVKKYAASGFIEKDYSANYIEQIHRCITL